jgi:hypothetical protein
MPSSTGWAGSAGRLNPALAHNRTKSYSCYDAVVAKARTTITVDERVLRAVRVKAARSGRRDSDVIEEALRRDLGLDLLERVWESADLDEDEALRVATEAQHESRRDESRRA